MSVTDAEKAGKKLVGWGAIELHAGMSRKTLLRHGYPVLKAGGTAWAMADEIDRHMLKISRVMQQELPT